jgi:hypothetical protein
MESRRAQHGAFKTFEVLGTIARGPDLAVTDVRLDFERGSVFNRYVWRGGRLVDVQSGPRPRSFRLVPLSDREWAVFDISTGIGARIAVPAPGPDAIEIQTAAGKTRAARVS